MDEVVTDVGVEESRHKSPGLPSIEPEQDLVTWYNARLVDSEEICVKILWCCASE